MKKCNTCHKPKKDNEFRKLKRWRTNKCLACMKLDADALAQRKRDLLKSNEWSFLSKLPMRL